MTFCLATWGFFWPVILFFGRLTNQAFARLADFFPWPTDCARATIWLTAKLSQPFEFIIILRFACIGQLRLLFTYH